jgi:hypothetical protein
VEYVPWSNYNEGKGAFFFDKQRNYSLLQVSHVSLDLLHYPRKVAFTITWFVLLYKEDLTECADCFKMITMYYDCSQL